MAVSPQITASVNCVFDGNASLDPSWWMYAQEIAYTANILSHQRPVRATW